MTITIHLDTIGSLLTFAGGVLLAVDALTARRRTRVRRGGKKLLAGLQKLDGEDNAKPQNPIQTADGKTFNSPQSLEDWTDRHTTWRARWGFALMAIGLGIDLWTKSVSNPLLLAKDIF